jgi:hypothetical protein
MALQKIITLPNTTTGSYIRIGNRRIDDPNASDRTARAHFNLFATESAADAAPQAPICPVIACLTLQGARYDEYFSKAALEAAGWNTTAQFYRALKAAAVGHNPGEVSPGGGLQTLDLSDASDV